MGDATEMPNFSTVLNDPGRVRVICEQKRRIVSLLLRKWIMMMSFCC